MMEEQVACCGFLHATPFCPQCGKKLASDVASELTIYLRKGLASCQKRLSLALQEREALTEGSPEWNIAERSLNRARKDQEKWSRRLSYLDNLKARVAQLEAQIEAAGLTQGIVDAER